MARWNEVIRKHGIDFELKLPHRGFHRAIGIFADVRVSPEVSSRPELTMSTERSKQPTAHFTAGRGRR